MTGIVVGRFGAMLAALHIIVLSVVGTLALVGKLELRSAALLRYLVITSLSLALLVVLLRAYFNFFVPPPPPRENVLSSIPLMEERQAASIVTDVPQASVTQLAGTRLDHILGSGVLQVGYRPNNLPCSFITPDGELVGFDVEMAHIMAEDLEVELEFVPFEFPGLGRMLASGQIDIAMSCIAALPDRHVYASFSRPYLDLSLAFVVRDHEREQFSDLQLLRSRESLTIAMVSTYYWEQRMRRLLPNARIVFLEAAEDFFNGNSQGADALMLTAEEGSAYAYRYPHYTIARPPRKIGVPAGYAIPKGDVEMIEFVSNWIYLKRSEGAIEALYQYWMLGGAAEPREPRWSIIRNVLGWVD